MMKNLFRWDDVQWVYQTDKDITIQVCGSGAYFSVVQYNEEEATLTHHKIFDNLKEAMNFVVHLKPE